MSSAQDVRFNEERVKQGRDLANKLWNASRLILLRVSDVEPDAGAASTVEDRWIVSRLERHTARVTELFDGFRFSHAALDLYGAFWSELCDWYLELAKPRLYDEDNEAVSAVLLWALERTLRLLHPVMPFVTEEIWSLMPGERGLLAVADWPVADESSDRRGGRGGGRAPDRGRHARCAATARRSAPSPRRSSAGGWPPTATRACRATWPGSARFELVDDASGNGDVLATVPVPGGGMQVLPVRRLRPGRGRAPPRGAGASSWSGEIQRAERKLANEQFVERAPAEVVAEERRKLEEYREALRRLETE